MLLALRFFLSAKQDEKQLQGGLGGCGGVRRGRRRGRALGRGLGGTGRSEQQTETEQEEQDFADHERPPISGMKGKKKTCKTILKSGRPAAPGTDE